jgi:hypothetical protein
LFFPSLQTLLLASDRNGHPRDDALLICVPAKACWTNLIEQLLSNPLESHEDARKRRQRLDDFDHIVADSATVKEATAAALTVLRDARVNYSADMLQLFVAKASGRIKFWGASVDAEPRGPFASLHQRMRGQMLAWLRMLERFRYAALPAILTTVCSIVATGVGLAVSNLITGRLEKVATLLRLAAGDGIRGTLLQHGIASTALFSPRWRHLKETLSLFIVPYLLSLLYQLFPSGDTLKMSRESRLIMQSVSQALAGLVEEYDSAGHESGQDVVGVFAEYTRYLKLPPPQERQAKQVLLVTTNAHRAVGALLQARSGVELMSAFFGVAQAVLFGSSDPSVIAFARSASVVLGGAMRRGSAIWAEAGFTARHGKAMEVAADLRTPLAIWASVSSSTAEAVGAEHHSTSSRDAVAEVVEALDGAYRIRVAEDLRMASCQTAPQVLQKTTREWLRASSRLLFPSGSVTALPGTLALRGRFRQQIASALMSSQAGQHVATEWPDLETMDEQLASRIQAWLRPQAGSRHRRREPGKKAPATASELEKSLGPKWVAP